MTESMPPELRAIKFPNSEAQRRYGALIGVDEVKRSLLVTLQIATVPQAFGSWAEGNGVAPAAVALVLDRHQLFIFGGDVGTGKTELAETVGDALARQMGATVTLFTLSLATRGTGFVGEMTGNIVKAFDYVRLWGDSRTRSKPKKAAGIFFIDEADAIAQSRGEVQMHHEDRAGVNALIRSLDDLNRARVPVAVILASNRLDSLDPAVVRRAANIYRFDRPDDDRRRVLFSSLLPGAAPQQIDHVVIATGPNASRRYGYTYSDLTQRLIPSALLEAYVAKTRFGPDIVLAQTNVVQPTPPFDV